MKKLILSHLFQISVSFNNRSKYRSVVGDWNVDGVVRTLSMSRLYVSVANMIENINNKQIMVWYGVPFPRWQFMYTWTTSKKYWLQQKELQNLLIQSEMEKYDNKPSVGIRNRTTHIFCVSLHSSSISPSKWDSF